VHDGLKGEVLRRSEVADDVGDVVAGGDQGVAAQRGYRLRKAMWVPSSKRISCSEPGSPRSIPQMRQSPERTRSR
jgi:hypothetical protein